MLSCSMDGSSFDSTQHYENMEAVDAKFWNMIAPHMVNAIS